MEIWRAGAISGEIMEEEMPPPTPQTHPHLNHAEKNNDERKMATTKRMLSFRHQQQHHQHPMLIVFYVFFFRSVSICRAASGRRFA